MRRLSEWEIAMHDRETHDLARGIAAGLLLSLPLWALAVALVWLGLRAAAF